MIQSKKVKEWAFLDGFRTEIPVSRFTKELA